MRDKSYDRCIAAIARGRKQTVSETRYLADSAIVDEFFHQICEADVEGTFTILENSTSEADKREASTMLVAYLDWCLVHNKEYIGSSSLEHYLARLASNLVSAMCGRSSTYDIPCDYEYQLPNWRSPDVALGWKKAPHRPIVSNKEALGMQVCAFFVLLKRQGVGPTAAKKRAAQRFGDSLKSRSISWVEKQLKNHPEEYLCSFSDDELANISHSGK